MNWIIQDDFLERILLAVIRFFNAEILVKDASVQDDWVG